MSSSGSDRRASTNAAGQVVVRRSLVSLVPGATLTDTQKKAVIGAAANAHVVAQCAMRVQRSAEVSAEASFLPVESCGCYWESVATGKTPASCTACPNGLATSWLPVPDLHPDRLPLRLL